jgi:hypothetical protein
MGYNTLRTSLRSREYTWEWNFVVLNARLFISHACARIVKKQHT